MKKKIIIAISIVVFVLALVVISIFLNRQNETEIEGNDKQETAKTEEKIIEVTSRNFEEEVIKSEVSVLITVGEASQNIAKRALEIGEIANIIIHECKTNEEAIKFAKEELKQGDIVLVKASNAMHFDEIVEKIQM